MPPLVRPQLPEPDWRAEEVERARRAAGDPASEPEASLQPYPAKPMPKAKAKPTPRLDALKRELGRP